MENRDVKNVRRRRRKRKTGGAAVSRPSVKRRGRRGLYWVSALALTALVGLVLSLTVFFKIGEVSVSGDSPYTQEQVVQASGIEIGKNLWLLDTGEMAAAVKESLAYAERVSVKRRLPSTIVIEVAAPEITAAAEISGGMCLISGEGRILERNYDGPAVVYKGIAGGEDGGYIDGDAALLLERHNAILRALEKCGLGGLADSIYAAGIAESWFVYDGRLKVELGSSGNLEKKLDGCLNFIENNLGGDEVGVFTAKETDKQYFRPTDWRGGDASPGGEEPEPEE